MSLAQIDPVLATPKRLAAMGMIHNATKIDFAFIAEHLDMSASDLSKQMSALADAGYVKARKTGRGAERKTWYSATKQGAQALESHAQALRDLVAGSGVGAVDSSS